MSRYRPPAPASSRYITAQGFQALSLELESLWAQRREVVRFVTAAAAEGDRSENAEYTYRKGQLRALDRRIGYLQRRMPSLQVVQRPHGAGQLVYFGAWVTLVDRVGLECRYRIVGADEIDPASGGISVDSPMARALLGRRVDDEVKVRIPEGEQHLRIVSIYYAAQPPQQPF